MFILGNLIIGIALAISTVLSLLTLIIVVHAIMTLLNVSATNKVYMYLCLVVNPLFNKVSSFIPAKYCTYGRMDLVPLYTLLIIIIVQNGILPSVFRIGRSLVN